MEDNELMSRIEKILHKMLGDEIELDEAQSRNEELLIQVLKLSSTMKGEIDDLDEKSGKLLIPAGNKTYLAQLQVVNNKPVLAYVEEE